MDVPSAHIVYEVDLGALQKYMSVNYIIKEKC